MKRSRACDDLVALERHCSAASLPKRNKVESLSDSFARVQVSDKHSISHSISPVHPQPRRTIQRLLQVDVQVESAHLDRLSSKLEAMSELLLDEPLPLLRLRLPQDLELESPTATDSPLLRPSWCAFDRVCVHAA